MSTTATGRRPLVLANWKANGDHNSNQTLIEALCQGWKGLNKAEMVICPPHCYLGQVSDALAHANIEVGAQDISRFERGAYTGDVTAFMLAEFGCRYVIVGHSERREYFSETDAQVIEKFQRAQEQGLTPILCVGESLQERDAGKALEKIGAQIKAVLDSCGRNCFVNALIAYEPIWAVGTGRIATPEQVEEVHQYIREIFGELGDKIRILYGGSVKADNAAETFALDDVDGALVGGASLKAEDFLTICRAANN